MINQRRTPVSKIAEWTVAAAVPYALRMSAYSPSLLLLLALAACTAANKDETASDPSSSAGTTTATTAAGSDTATTGQPGSVSQTDPDPTTDPTTDPPTGSDSSGPPTTDTNNTTTDTSDPGTTTGVPAVSFTDVFEQVILPNGCNAGYCHGGGAGGLEMTDEATSYANLVEVKAAVDFCDQTMRVVPGSLDESSLWIRVRPADLDGLTPCATGNKMPKGSMGLTAPEAQLVSDWIVGGALE
jgi:hypothetical protein